MANLVQGLVGNSGIAQIIGKKAGDMVEDMVENAMGGDQEKKEAEKGGGFGMGDVLALAGGKKEDNEGGFGMGDVLALAGGKKEDNEGGFGLQDALTVAGGKKEGGGDGGAVKDLIGGFFN
ncbi:calpain clp-1 isoform X1 [Scophthalmus maximus]|uniref:calpain clp-1 isoform X1 n=1 Tax=Scophthalmus maximus TaxID=52904 RepID=UPI0015E14218|nr:calpain clp-1 isoform X1 [Scophthalmus maximus]